MSVVAILPIKSFDQSKQRLASELTSGPRRAMAEAMFADVLTALRRAASIDEIVVVSSDRAAQRLAGGHGASVAEDQRAGHSEAAALGIARALEAGAARVLCVPGDCPLLDPAEVDALVAHPVDGRSALIVPDRHGTGTNALLLTPPDALTPSFGPDSCERHYRLATEQGARPEVLSVASLALDIDTPDDLTALQETLAVTHGGAAHTRGMLSQLLRSRA
jgi:2-phospho-L-lactate guanylyltransferase